jgi:hypothetical protein
VTLWPKAVIPLASELLLRAMFDVGYFPRNTPSAECEQVPFSPWPRFRMPIEC